MDTPDGALGAWLLQSTASAQPTNGSTWWPTSNQDQDRATEEVTLSAADAAELSEMRTRLELTRARAALQRDPAWLDELSPDERAEERHAAEAIRAARRAQILRAATATEKLSGRAQRVENRIAAMELSDRLWSRRAT